jgi:long-chain fatty acid transport protein
MGYLKFTCVVLLGILALSATALAGGFENNHVGLKATAMGGAFRAFADDWTAAYYNPAAYALIPDNQFGANAAFLHYRNEIVPNYRRTAGPTQLETGFFNDRSIYNPHEILSNPSAGLVLKLPVAGESVFGFSIYQPFDYNINWELFRPLTTYGGNYSLPKDQYRTNLDVVAFQLSAGREFQEEQLYLGLGVELLRADLIFSELSFRDNPMPAPFDDRPFELIPQWSKNDGYGFGLGFRTGLLWKANEKITVGLTGHLPFDINISGDSTQLNFYLPDVADTVALRTAGYPLGSIGYLFGTGAQINALAEFETKLKLPASAGIGLAFAVTEKLTVALDAQYTLWSKFEGLDFEYSNFSQISKLVDTSFLVDGSDTTYTSDWVKQNTSHPVDWKNTGRVMMGAQFEATTLFTLYAGGYADQSPARNATQFTPNFVDTGDKYGFSGGVMFHIKEWDFGFASTYTSYPDLTIAAIDSDGDGTADSLPGLYKAEQFETVLSFIYRF